MGANFYLKEQYSFSKVSNTRRQPPVCIEKFLLKKKNKKKLKFGVQVWPASLLRHHKSKLVFTLRAKGCGFKGSHHEKWPHLKFTRS